MAGSTTGGRQLTTTAFAYSHPPTRANAAVLQEILDTSEVNGLPDYNVSPAQGKYLALHCKAANVSNVLEVGTLGGYSAVWMASENPRLRVTSIERSRRHVEIARKNITHAGLSDRIEVIHGMANDVLDELRDEIRAGLRPRFNFVFIDADKKSNWAYFQKAKDMVKPNSVICIDNIARQSQLADANDVDPDVMASWRVVEQAGKEPGVDSVVLQTVGGKSYGGWLWAVVS